MSKLDKNLVLYVSYYANREISGELVKPISISRGNPRFRISYKIEDRIPELVPNKKAWAATTEDDFRRAYIEQLETLGIEKVQIILERLKDETGRPLVLLCFEDLIREDKMFCHRQVFSSWYKHYTNISVPEFSLKTLSHLEPMQLTGRRRILPVTPEPAKITRRRRTPTSVASRLFKIAIYVNASDKHLKDASCGPEPSKRITENKRWVKGERLWNEARSRGEELPLIFAVFKELTYWAVAREIIVDDEKRTTSYRFAHLRPLRGYERRHLVVDSKGEALPNNFIKSYALVRTPEWIG